jgi:hypothetical protein
MILGEAIMNKECEDAIVRRAAQLYREWETRPWRVKVWDRIKSAVGHVRFLLMGR